ncbi:unnamed protein product [Polarella glacialis]|uniref:Uncharacterized protein n=1 Tax=Polarella glacialis TaxID=89957 RepID=A0A813JMK9_POLGL|nr:unnamed protein product [Polarella glacialis]
MLQCWTRSDKAAAREADGESQQDSWLTAQLKFTRDQLDKKSSLCDQLAGELRRLQAELESKSSAQDGREEQCSPPRSPALPRSPARSPREQPLSPASRFLRVPSLDDSNFRRIEVQQLQQELAKERELHQEALRLLQAQREDRDHNVCELQQEMRDLGAGWEQREEDILSIQFSMVELQNRLKDQAALVAENADAFQIASEDLAEKEDDLEKASHRQQELLKEMNEVSGQLQAKVKQLSQELEGSKASYRALEQQTSSVVQRLEADRDVLSCELKRATAEDLQDVPDSAEEPETPRRKLAAAEAYIADLTMALERSRLLEHQDRGQEYRTSQAMSRTFARGGPNYAEETPSGFSFGEKHADLEEPDSGQTSLHVTPAVPSVLIAAEIDLGPPAGRATLTVAPWQTRSDFDSIVHEFLAHHRVKPVFEKALVHYLDDVEKQATTFPTLVTANISDIYNRYG